MLFQWKDFDHCFVCAKHRAAIEMLPAKKKRGKKEEINGKQRNPVKCP